MALHYGSFSKLVYSQNTCYFPFKKYYYIHFECQVAPHFGFICICLMQTILSILPHAY